MLLKRIYDDHLAQASYLLGCQATGEALVIDPNRDIEQYLAMARDERLRITHVTETHIHADFASGSRELASRSGARLLLSDCGDADWKYRFAGEADTQPLRDGDTFMVGNLAVDVVHTPGHTPEHVVFVVTDTPAADRAIGAFTGDFIFVGDVGRPDLLERAAGVRGSMEAGARTLFASLQRFKQQPDHLQLWPGHGAGSACGKALGAMPSSTLGYERIANWALRTESEEEFVAEVLAGQPAPPRYFARMKRINRDGVPALGMLPSPVRLARDDAQGAVARGASLLDIRAAAAYAEHHVAGAINVPLNRSFVNWAGAVLDYDRDTILIAGDDGADAARAAARDLVMIGFDRVAGWIDSEAAAHLGNAPARGLLHVTVDEVAPQAAAGAVTIVDVRNPSEWEQGHLPGAVHIPLGELADRLAEVPRGKPIVMQCQGGSRSAIAASVLDASGIPDVANLTGGYAAWERAGKDIRKTG